MNQNLVVQTLRNLSDAVYYVGGYVRDKFLGVVSKDVDIAVDADANIVYDALKSVGLRPGQKKAKNRRSICLSGGCLLTKIGTKSSTTLKVIFVLPNFTEAYFATCLESYRKFNNN